MAFPELRNDPSRHREVPITEGCHPQPSGGSALQVFQDPEGTVLEVDEVPRERNQHVPGSCEADPPGSSRQEPDAKLALERLHALCEGRLCQTELDRGVAEVT